MKLQVINTIGKNTTLTVKDEMFGQPINEQLLAQAVHVYQANQHIGISKVKTRGEIARTKKKWFRQKGTGNARHGARSANIFVGGGIAHGPKGLKNKTLSLSSKMRKKALIIALSAQAKHIIVCDDIEKLDGKTASGDKLLKAITPEAKRVLVILSEAQDRVLRSLRNIERVLSVQANQVNVLDVVLADSVVITKKALEQLESRLLAKKEPDKKAKETKTESKKTAPKKPAAKTTQKSTKTTKK